MIGIAEILPVMPEIIAVQIMKLVKKTNRLLKNGKMNLKFCVAIFISLLLFFVWFFFFLFSFFIRFPHIHFHLFFFFMFFFRFSFLIFCLPSQSIQLILIHFLKFLKLLDFFHSFVKYLPLL
jgi:hypothetical protein